VEGLASGRPALVTEQVGLAEILRDSGAGVISARSGPAVAQALDRLEGDWKNYGSAARRLAERWFGADRFLDEYRRLYDEMLAARRIA